MPKKAFVPWVESVASTTPGTRAELQLKLAALYHPTIFFPVETSFVECVCEGIAKDAGNRVGDVRKMFKSVHEIKGLRNSEEFLLMSLTPEDGFTWDKRGGIKPGLRGAVYRSLARADGISVRQVQRNIRKRGVIGYAWTRAAAYKAASATGGANAWRQINHVLPCDLICFNEAANFAAINRISSDVSKVDGTVMDAIEVAIPSVTGLGWDHVFELRKNRHVDAFRGWIAEKTDPQKSAEIIDGLWSAFGEIIPNPSSTVLKGITSNIPLPIPINPASVAYAAQDARQAIRFQKQHSATIFFHDLWRLTSG